MAQNSIHPDQQIKEVVILGGGTAGWMSACYLAKFLQGTAKVVLMESPAISKIGVGEATVPNLQKVFFDYLGIPEFEWMRQCNASFKVAVRFVNWRTPGPGVRSPRSIGCSPDHFYHPFGILPSVDQVPLSHYWNLRRHRQQTNEAFDYACFTEPPFMDAKRAPRWFDGRAATRYAWHMDAHLVADFLRRHGTEKLGVVHIHDEMDQVEFDERGYVAALHTKGGRRISGDLFIDCTGFRGLLIEETLKSGFEDWSHWLPTDAAFALQTESVGPPLPYTKAIAHHAGWRWRIPLQHRVGNGSVFCSEFSEPDEVRELLLSSIEGDPITEPRLVRYKAGKRREVWKNNVIAMGLSSGFVEPLESTSIHLFMAAATRLVQQFPFGPIAQAQRDRYNRMADNEIDRVRDFVILHYKLTRRDDSPLWNYVRDMDIPDTLAERITLFAEQAEAWQAADDLFRVDSWAQVMLGQGVVPRGWHRMGALMGEGRLKQALDELQAQIAATVTQIPPHDEFVKSYCS